MNQTNLLNREGIPILEPTHHDVLCGRGNRVNFHKGNEFFRKLVNSLRNEYVASAKKEKPHFAKMVQDHIRSLDPPGRFLKRASDNDRYIDVGIKLSIDKTSQALREGKPALEKKIKSGELVIEKFEAYSIITERARQVYVEVFPELSGATKNNANDVVSPPDDDRNSLLNSKYTGPDTNFDTANEDTKNVQSQNYDTQETIGTEEFLPGEAIARPSVLSQFSDISGVRIGQTFQSFASNSTMMELNDSYHSASNPDHFYDIKTGQQIELNNSFRRSMAPDYEWRTRNNLYLEDIGDREKMKRRASSINMVRYIQSLQAIASDDDNDESSCDSFQRRINEAIVDKKYIRDSMSMSSNSLADSMQFSVEMNDKPDTSRAKYSSVRFSMLSRRSTRMSLTLRQSLLGTFCDDEEDEDEIENETLPHNGYESHYIPDVFSSQRDRRRSIVTESKEQLISSFYGQGAAETLVEDPHRMSLVFNNVIAPITQDDILRGMDDL